VLCAVVALCVLPDVSSGQSGLRSASLPDTPALAAARPDALDLFRARPDTFASRDDRLPTRHRHPFAGYSYEGPWLTTSRGSRASHSRPHQSAVSMPSGYLQLLVEPATAEVHIDGFYQGTVEDFRRSGGRLEAGPHRIELRAPGHEPVTFSVNIAPRDTVTYRSDLNESARAAARSRASVPTPPPAPPMPKAFYVIPGCFAGDKPPTRERLSPACNISQLRTIPPVVSVVARGR
jgi:hypothetical protein